MHYHLFLAKAILYAGNCSLKYPNLLTVVGRDDNVNAAEKFARLFHGIEEKGVKGIDNARHSIL